MPNWCENTLRIRGKKKDVQTFVKKAKSKNTDLSFNNFVPIPAELEQTQSPAHIVKETEYKKAIQEAKKEKRKGFTLGLPITEKRSKEFTQKFGANNWYDWNLENWGTKWDIKAELIDNYEDGAEYSFDTAWSPPIAWLDKVSRLYPSIDFFLKYEEGGMGFLGVAKARNGIVDDKTLEW